MTMYISKVQISTNPTTTVLRSLIEPPTNQNGRTTSHTARGDIADIHHRLIWSLFPNDPDKTRDFLWRYNGDGSFLILSPEKPSENATEIFDRPQTKEFAPQINEGDVLEFALRYHATSSVFAKNSTRGRKIDIVLNELKDTRFEKMPGSLNQKIRKYNLADIASNKWLKRQGEANGFTLIDSETTDYQVSEMPVHRRKNNSAPIIGIIESKGLIRINDPHAFLTQYKRGWGRAKAFGCGFMLIKRSALD